MRPLVMGVLNVTPDSFSDGGRYLDPEAAVAHGLALARGGADIIDVGGESTRPGAVEVAAHEEEARVVPVIRALTPHIRVSVDTRKREVAEAAVDAGASLINDVSASLWPVAADASVGWVAMHMQGTPLTMQDEPAYGDVVAEVSAYLAERASAAREAGVEEVWIDPGIGFGKTDTHNLTLLARLRTLTTLGFPVLVGTSRKGMLGRLLGGAAITEREEASLATAVWSMSQGASMVRVHDVGPAVCAARLVGEDVSA